MKKIKIMMMALMMCFTSLSFGQNSIEHCKDVMTDKEYAFFKRNLLCSDDNKKGFVISINLKMNNSVAEYDGFSIRSVGIGGCVENSTVIFLFEDTTKTSLTSWNKFNCEGRSYFDVRGSSFDEISNKKIKAIRFINGRTHDSYTYILKEKEREYFIECRQLLFSKVYVETKCE